MRITTLLRSTLCIFFLGVSYFLSAQNSIGLFSTLTLNPRAELINGSTNYPLHIQGAGIEYRRDWETHHLFAFAAGFNNIQERIRTSFCNRSKLFIRNTSNEIYLQARWKLFNPIINMPRLKGFYSLGPELFYFKQLLKDNRIFTGSLFSSQEMISGVDIQVGFNIDYDLGKRIKLIGYINPVSFVSTFSITDENNPGLTRDQNRVSVYNFDVNIFSELRVGVMYNFANLWKKSS